MTVVNDLLEVATRFDAAALPGQDDKVSRPIKARVDASLEVGKAFSGSWLGYHSLVYQDDIQPIPGAVFDSRWGLTHAELSDSRGNWVQYDGERLKQHIRSASGNVRFEEIACAAKTSVETCRAARADLTSIMATALKGADDAYLGKLLAEVEGLRSLSYRDAVAVYRPSGHIASADGLAMVAGLQTPPHVAVLAEMAELSSVFEMARRGAELARRAALHVQRNEKRKRAVERIGTNVFIGHGRSPLWRELKDFVQDRLSLPADEFNRVPVAGQTNVQRLLEMLDAAAIAFLVMTAEDETAEGAMQARMNVIHEVGLFQGRLGFSKAIIMLEDGCAHFSNVHGLGQIRFPKGEIKAAFEEVRAVLEREGVVS